MSFVKAAIMIIVMLTLFGGANYYLAHRVCRCIRFFFPNFRIIIPIIVFAALTVVMFLSVARPFGGTLQRIVSTVGSYWMGIFVYLLLFFLFADLVVFIIGRFPVNAMKTVRFAAGAAAVALALITSVYGFLHVGQLYTVRYDISISSKSQNKMNVVMISDVHLGAVGSESRLKKIVNQINELKPDLVCIAGDFFDNDYDTVSDPDKAIETLREISATYGVYACLGNHDSGSTFNQMEDFFGRANIFTLNDEYVIIDQRLILAGRLDGSPIGGYKGIERKALSDVLMGADTNLPIVMMDHNPANVDTYNGEVDLILCGHTHKGQIFPGNLITDAIYTVDYGYYRSDNNTQVVVTSGVGTWGLPMRVGTNCEIVNINLQF